LSDIERVLKEFFKEAEGIWLRYLTLQDDRKIIIEDFLNG